MSTLRISNIEAKSVPASATIDEKVKITNSSGDTLVFIDGKTSGITTVGINTTDSNITFDANSNIVVTGIITATRFSGQITPTSLEIGSNIKLGNAGVITATSFVGSGANLTNLPSQVTITGNANNKVITGGSGTNLVGETRLTFDGNSLDITGSGSHPFSVSGGDYRNLVITGNSQSSSGFIYLGNSAATTNADFDLGRIRIYNGSTQVVQIAGSTDTSANDDGRLVFATRNTGGSLQERVRITSTGEMGVNTIAPVEKLGISGNMRFVNPNGNTSRITALPSGTYNTGVSGGSAICFQRTADGGGGSDEIFFETHWQGNRHGESCRINKYGNLTFPSGQGIDFSATGDASGKTSELLDDYEEGSWTPVIAATSANPSFTFASGFPRGRYRKIGGQVTLWYDIAWGSLPSQGGGTLLIQNFPYSTGSSLYHGGGLMSHTVGTNAGGAYTGKHTHYANPNSGFMYILSGASTNGHMQATALNGSGHIFGFFTYAT